MWILFLNSHWYFHCIIGSPCRHDWEDILYANVIHGKRGKFEKLLEGNVARALAFGIQLQTEDCIAFKLLHMAPFCRWFMSFWRSKVPFLSLAPGVPDRHGYSGGWVSLIFHICRTTLCLSRARRMCAAVTVCILAVVHCRSPHGLVRSPWTAVRL